MSRTKNHVQLTILSIPVLDAETSSGLNDMPYQDMSSLAPDLPHLKQLVTNTKVPLPREIMEHFARILF